MMSHRFDPNHRHALVDQERSAEQPAEDMVSRAEVVPGSVVADLGCGNGYLSIPLARMAGRVIALDISQDMLLALMERCDATTRGRIDPVRCELPDLPLRPSSLDHVFMVNVLHEFEDKKRMVQEVSRVLRPGGKATLVDFQKRQTKRGPPVEERIDEREVPGLFAGMDVVRSYGDDSFYQFEITRPL